MVLVRMLDRYKLRFAAASYSPGYDYPIDRRVAYRLGETVNGWDMEKDWCL